MPRLRVPIGGPFELVSRNMEVVVSRVQHTRCLPSTSLLALDAPDVEGPSDGSGGDVVGLRLRR